MLPLGCPRHSPQRPPNGCCKARPFTVRPTSDPFQLRWMLKMFANCTPAAYAVNKGRMVRLAEYSRDCMKQLRGELALDYEGRQLGTLQLFRSQAQLDASQRDIAVLEEYGVPYQSLNADGCEEVEPALARVRGKVVGACACREMKPVTVSASPRPWRTRPASSG